MESDHRPSDGYERRGSRLQDDADDRGDHAEQTGYRHQYAVEKFPHERRSSRVVNGIQFLLEPPAADPKPDRASDRSAVGPFVRIFLGEVVQEGSLFFVFVGVISCEFVVPGLNVEGWNHERTPNHTNTETTKYTKNTRRMLTRSLLKHDMCDGVFGGVRDGKMHLQHAAIVNQPSRFTRDVQTRDALIV